MLGARLGARYAELARDADLSKLVPFYACQRAYIRGKVDSLKSAETEVDTPARAAARQSAIDHFALAYRYTWSYTPRLVVVCGLSGTGKSTVAAALHARTGFAHINSDTTRKRLAGIASTARPGPALYTSERSAATYEAMYAAARAELAAGRGALLDATFQRRAHRDAARDVARHCGVPILFAECVAPEEEIHRRLAERGRANTDASDADWTVYEQQRATYEPFAADEYAERVIVDTTRPLDEQLTSIESKLRAS